MRKCIKSNYSNASMSRRLMWLITIWVGSVIALGVVAGGFRLMMAWAGMVTH